MLTRLTDDGELLDGIFELDNATNDRLLAESGLLPGIDARELVFGIPLTGLSMQPSATRHRMAPASIRQIEALGMQALNWRLPRPKWLTTSNSGCRKRIGMKRRSLSTLIIERISARTPRIRGARKYEIACLRLAMSLRRRSLPNFWKQA